MKRSMLSLVLGLSLLLGFTTAPHADAAITTSTSFTATGAGSSFAVDPLKSPSITYAVSGTWVGTVQLQSSQNPTAYWNPVLSFTSNGTGSTSTNPTTVLNGPGIQPVNGAPLFFRFYCTAYTSGTIVTAFSTTDLLTRTLTVNGYAKAGTTSGYVVGAGNNLGTLATLPASQTASTLVVWVPGLRPGDVITGYQVLGTIGSSGNTVTLDADLRYLTNAASAQPTDASLGTTITQVSVTAAAAVSAAAGVGGVNLATAHTVLTGESFYALITGTTGSSTTQTIQAVQVTYVPGP